MYLGIRPPVARGLAAGLILAGAVAFAQQALDPWRAERAVGPSATLPAVSRALSIDPGSPRLHFLQAVLLHQALAGSDPARARQAYAEALRRNPLNGPYLLELAKLYRQMGFAEQSAAALAAVVQTRPRDPDLLWEAAVFQIQAGRVGEAVGLLQRILRDEPPMRPRVYALLYNMYPARPVLENLLPADPEIVGEYLELLAGRRDMEGASAAWWRLVGLNPRPALRFVAFYTELLIDRRDFSGAMAAWGRLGAAGTRSPEDGGNLVVNGGFEPRETFGRGFDWRMGGAGGLDVDFVRGEAGGGERALRLRVRGAPAVGEPAVWQVIPLTGGRAYRLSAFLRSDGGGAGVGVALRAVDLTTNQVLATLGPATGTSARTRLSADFSVPPGSIAVRLNVQLVAATALAGRPSGTAWVDGVALEPRS